MKRIQEYLEKAKIYYLGTITADNKPRIRPWGTIYLQDNTLYTLTKSTKNVAKEILNNKSICISSILNDSFMIFNCDAIIENNDELKKVICQKYAHFGYKVEDQDILLLKLTNCKACIYHANRNKEIII
jgi:uncharacterized pyridoxamine 5'-phosphate oxidase family protein